MIQLNQLNYNQVTCIRSEAEKRGLAWPITEIQKGQLVQHLISILMYLRSLTSVVSTTAVISFVLIAAICPGVQRILKSWVTGSGSTLKAIPCSITLKLESEMRIIHE